MDMYDPIIIRIRKEMNDIADHLSTGGATDFEDYKFLVGKIEALAIMERYTIDLRAEQDMDPEE